MVEGARTRSFVEPNPAFSGQSCSRATQKRETRSFLVRDAPI